MPLFAFRSEWEPAPRPTLADTTVFAIGDVHGHLAHLEAMLGLIRPAIAQALAAGRSCRLVLIGDYVDRGPASLPVLRRVLELEREELGIPVHALCGNHDLYLIQFAAAAQPDPEALQVWRGNGGDTTLAELGIGTKELARRDLAQSAAAARATLGPEVMALLGRLELCRAIGGYLFAHAGVHPRRPLEEHTARDLLWLREPFLSGTDWQQPFTVVHGHTIRGPEVLPHRIAIDSGAYRTGVLTTVELADDRLRFLCVAATPDLGAFRRLPGQAQPRRFTEPTPLPD